MTIIIWYGLRRSGNHGLIQLIINSLQCTYFFHNNITLSHENYLKNINKNELSIYKNVEILILSVENKRIDFDEIIKFEKNENVIKVLIIRNPYNMCSSNYEMFGKDVEYLKKIIILWIEYVKFILYENKNFVIIFYDKFYNDENYRNEISKLLNITFDYTKINLRENYARSSFKNTKTNEFNRFKHFEQDDIFLECVLKNKELQTYYKLLCDFFNYKDLYF